MSDVQTAISPEAPLMKAFEQWKKSDRYANTRKWAQTEHVDGSLWAAFGEGFRAATERAAALAEQVDNASNTERLNNVPGCDAMGAVIQYRDLIREQLP